MHDRPSPSWAANTVRSKRRAEEKAVAAARFNKYEVVADTLFARQEYWGANGKVDEVVFPVLFLCSSYAQYITGQVIHVSGGFYMG